MKPKPGPQVAWQIIDGEAVIVDLATGATIGLNPTATFLWSHLDGRDATALAEALAAEFEVERAEADADVRDFLGQMQERKLIIDTEPA